MAVRIISDSERNVMEYSGSKFYYRRISISKSMEINRNHTKRGLTDHIAAGLEMVEWCLLGWDNVEDENGNSVEFNKGLIRSLPDEIINELTMVLRDATPGVNALGN